MEQSTAHNADTSEVADAAVIAWNTPDEDGETPRDVYWDSRKDCWTDGYETGYRAALAAHGIDGDVQ